MNDTDTAGFWQWGERRSPPVRRQRKAPSEVVTGAGGLFVLRYIAGFTLGVLAAIVVFIAVVVTVHIPGPPDQEAGFGMVMFFIVLPILAYVFGRIGGAVAEARGKRYEKESDDPSQFDA
jgi:hypothetical protein